MTNTTIFNSVAFVYLLSSVLYFCYFFFRKESLGKTATAVTGAGFLAQTVGYVFRWIETSRLGFDHTPLAFFTLYETLVFAAWSMVIVYLIFEYKYRIKAFGAIILPIVSLVLLYASLSPNVAGGVKELPTVLQGNFFVYHIISCTISYAAFIISVVASVFLLLMGNPGKVTGVIKKILDRLPHKEILDDMSYKTIAIGFILFTIGMVTGIYRTKIIWGSYWSWDPVETSGLITWLLYALILHGRYQKWWGMKTSGVLSISAFTISILCFLIAGSYVLVSGHYQIL